MKGLIGFMAIGDNAKASIRVERQGSGLRTCIQEGLGFRVQGLGFRVQGLGSTV